MSKHGQLASHSTHWPSPEGYGHPWKKAKPRPDTGWMTNNPGIHMIQLLAPPSVHVPAMMSQWPEGKGEPGSLRIPKHLQPATLWRSGFIDLFPYKSGALSRASSYRLICRKEKPGAFTIEIYFVESSWKMIGKLHLWTHRNLVKGGPSMPWVPPPRQQHRTNDKAKLWERKRQSAVTHNFPCETLLEIYCRSWCLGQIPRCELRRLSYATASLSKSAAGAVLHKQWKNTMSEHKFARAWVCKEEDTGEIASERSENSNHRKNRNDKCYWHFRYPDQSLTTNRSKRRYITTYSVW